MVPQEVKEYCAFTYRGAYMIAIETVTEQVQAPLFLQRWNMHNKVIMISERIWWCSGKESASQCQRHKQCSFNLWAGKIPGKRNGNPLQHSFSGNPMDREAWWTTVHGVSKSWTWVIHWECAHAHTHTHTHTHTQSKLQDKISPTNTTERRKNSRKTGNCLILQVRNQSHFFG